MINFDSKMLRLEKRLKGLSAAITGLDNLYLFGIYPQNYPNLSMQVDLCKDHLKKVAKDTKFEITQLEEPNSKYDLSDGEKIEEHVDDE